MSMSIQRQTERHVVPSGQHRASSQRSAADDKQIETVRINAALSIAAAAVAAL